MQDGMIHVAITKATLRELNAVRGQLDLDSGLVFDQFIGRLDMRDGLYHGELMYSPPPVPYPADAEVVSISDILTESEGANGDT